MSTIRVARRKRFTAIDRRTVADESVSFRALGILTWLLDKPDDWTCDSTTIARGDDREGRDAVRTALNELVKAGYIVRTKRQVEGGKWVTETVVYERPCPNEPKTGNQASENQTSVFQALSTKTDTEYPPTPQGGLDEFTGYDELTEPRRQRKRVPDVPAEPPSQPARTYQGTPLPVVPRVEPTASGRAQLKNIKDKIRPPREETA